VVKETQSKNLATDEGQKALIVIATLVDMLTQYDEDDSNSIPCIRQLIRRVNEDRRRNDLMIGDEIELDYFDILSKSLHYNRLKLQDLKRKHDQDLDHQLLRFDLNQDLPRWEPQVKNIINALDLMSLNRTVTCIERMREKKDIKNLRTPVELYKEQIANLRILFESENISHNEIAIAGAGRIFYRTDQRLDQLPKLLSSFKPGVHEKAYLCVLVELVHETLKSLEAATVRCNAILDEEEKRRLAGHKKVKRSEESYEGYLSLCIGFDVKEYFKRLVTNNTILLYVKLLKEYKSLDPVILHYIYAFLHRVCTFKLEQKYPTPLTLPAAVVSTQSIEYEDSGLTLTYMLFNWQSMHVFNEILQDPRIDTTASMTSLVRLIKSVVRQLGFALQKNHMLYVDMLFHHTNPHGFCESIDNVYEATTWRNASKTAEGEVTKKSSKPAMSLEFGAEETDQESPEKNDNAEDRLPASTSKYDETIEEEFDDNFDFAMPTTTQSSKKSRSRKASSFDEDGDDENAARDGQKTKKKKRVAWSKAEDKILRELFAQYTESRSVYTMIADDEGLM
jgi:timeless